MDKLAASPPARAEMFGTLLAIRTLLVGCWPDAISDLRERALLWPTQSATELQSQITSLVQLLDTPNSAIRIFWKLAPGYAYRGVNLNFARDAGHSSIETMLGLSDFSPQVTWNQMAAKYRADDEEVVRTGEARLNILERQRSASGVVWLHTAKAPIRIATGAVIGLFGMYEILDEAAAVLLHRRLQRPVPT